MEERAKIELVWHLFRQQNPLNFMLQLASFYVECIQNALEKLANCRTDSYLNLKAKSICLFKLWIFFKIKVLNGIKDSRKKTKSCQERQVFLHQFQVYKQSLMTTTLVTQICNNNRDHAEPLSSNLIRVSNTVATLTMRVRSSWVSFSFFG